MNATAPRSRAVVLFFLRSEAGWSVWCDEEGQVDPVSTGIYVGAVRRDRRGWASPQLKGRWPTRRAAALALWEQQNAMVRTVFHIV